MKRPYDVGPKAFGTIKTIAILTNALIIFEKSLARYLFFKLCSRIHSPKAYQIL